MPDDHVLERTRRGLHAVAELVLAGPQLRASGTIRLRVTPGGFATVAAPEIRVEGLTVIAHDVRVAMSGETARSLADAVGVDVGAPGVYEDGSGASIDERLVLDADAAGQIASAYETGTAALRLLAPDVEPILWPEHFDVGIRVDGVNYGISPGDGFLGEPYAYIGVDPIPAGEFWNAPFGAARPMRAIETVEDLHAFFATA